VEDRQLDCKIYSVHTLQEFLQVLLGRYRTKGRSCKVREVDNSKLLIESDGKTRDKMSFLFYMFIVVLRRKEYNCC
jgi:hypothetical protein